jgi:D-serine deaminase-like pyridoxal phosphate-dependent protein
MRKEEIDTPALVIDIDTLERNLVLMNKRLADSPTKLRPHAKSHKTPEIAKLQIQYGAIGITCAKISEAEAMADGGIRDILVANELVGSFKNRRAAELAKRCNLIIACESAQNAQELSQAARAAGATIGAIVEIDIGNRRCGARTHERAIEVARAISSSPGLVFRGIMGYEGHCVFTNPLSKRREEAEKAIGDLVGYAEAIRRAGLPVEIVSGGGTGTYDITGHFPGITDIQAGSYMLMDARYAGTEGIDFENSLTLLSTVVSRPLDDLVVLDYGLKSTPREFGIPHPAPQVNQDGSINPFGMDGAEVFALSEEHARVQLKNPSRDLKVGDKVDIIPSHCCTTMNTHDFVYAVRKGWVEAVWRIAARGKSA